MACASGGPRLRRIAAVTRRRDCSVCRDYVPSRQTRHISWYSSPQIPIHLLKKQISQLYPKLTVFRRWRTTARAACTGWTLTANNHSSPGQFLTKNYALRGQLSHISSIASCALELSVLKYMIPPIELLCRSSKHFCWFPPHQLPSLSSLKLTTQKAVFR